MTMPSWIRNAFTRRPVTRPIRQARHRARPALEVLESRDLLSGIATTLSDMRSDFLPPVNNPLLSGPAATSGALGTGGSTAANVNTDTEAIAGPHNETSIAVDPTNPNHLIGSVNDYQLVVNPDGSITETVYSRAHVSFDRGQTWTNYGIPFPSRYDATGDPGVAFDADGRAYISTLGFNFFDATVPFDVLTSTSTDGGKTWATPTVVGPGSTTSSGTVANDKEYIAAWGHGNAIVTYTAFNFDSSGNYISSPIFATVTHDGGNSWSTPTQISGNFIRDQGSVPTVAADGSIYVSFESFDNEVAPNYRNNYMVVKVDPNTGQAVASPVVIALVHDGNFDYPISVDGRETYQDSQFRTWAFGNITSDPTNAQHLAMIWSDTRNNPYPDGVLPSLDPYSVVTNSDVIVSQSFDGGQTWSSPSAIQLPNDQFMPWGAYDETGRLQIGFFDRSYDSANHLYGYTVASERTQGQLNFNFQEVTTTLSDPTQGDRWFGVTVNAAFPNATRFLGDYSGIATVPGRRVAALWTDMRNSVSFLGGTGYSQDAYFGLVRSVPGHAPQGATSAGGGISTTSTAVAGSGGYTFSTIDDPNGPIANAAFGINSRGDVVGGYIDANFIIHGFQLSHGQYTTLDDPNTTFYTLPFGINASGRIVGLYIDASGVGHGFLLRGGQYSTIDPPNSVFTEALGINDSGDIVGLYVDTSFVEHGFLLSGGQYTTLDDPNGVNGTLAVGINARGQITGQYNDANFVTHGFLLSGGQYTTLDDPNGVATFITGINDHGQIVGGYIDATTFVEHGLVLSGGQYTTLDDPSSVFGNEIEGINDSGQIEGYYFDASFTQHAFLATPSKGSSAVAAAGLAHSRLGASGNGGSALGGGIFNAVVNPIFGATTLTLEQWTVTANQATGGAGGAGGNGGAGLGGGLFNGFGATVTMTHTNVTANEAGRGIYNLGTFYMDQFSAIEGNHASTSNDDVFGLIFI
jgi:hypothetical protein